MSMVAEEPNVSAPGILVLNADFPDVLMTANAGAKKE